MVRSIREKDREFYLQAVKEFYQSEAVLSPIPEEYAEKTFSLLLSGSPLATAYILEKDCVPLGYALLAHTWSQEAGGEVVWIEELYLRPEARNQGLGSEFFAFLEEKFPACARFRLEVEDENEGAVRLYRKLGYEFFPYKQMKKGN